MKAISKPIIAAIIGILIVVGALFTLYSMGLLGGGVGINVGDRAPEFTLTDIDGSTFSLTDYQGNVVVIDFMATWCGPCVNEMGHLTQIYSNYGGDVTIISIDVDPREANETIRRFKKSYGDDWIFASGPEVGTMYKVTNIPTLYILDQDGKIAHKHVGVTSASTLSSEIDEILK